MVFNRLLVVDKAIDYLIWSSEIFALQLSALPNKRGCLNEAHLETWRIMIPWLFLFMTSLFLPSVFTRLAAGLLAGASLTALSIPAEAGTKRPVRWNSGGAVWTTKSSSFAKFFRDGEIDDRALQAGINGSGWTADEVRTGMTKTYEVDLVGVSRFLYSPDGVKFLKTATRSYFPYWKMTKTAVPALRSAIIADSIDGSLSSAGIMANLPVDFRLADTCGTYDGAQNVCAEGQCQGDAQCTSLLSWYVFLPACIQANSALPADPVRQTTTMPVPGLW